MSFKVILRVIARDKHVEWSIEKIITIGIYTKYVKDGPECLPQCIVSNILLRELRRLNYTGPINEYFGFVYWC